MTVNEKFWVKLFLEQILIDSYYLNIDAFLIAFFWGLNIITSNVRRVPISIIAP